MLRILGGESNGTGGTGVERKDEGGSEGKAKEESRGSQEEICEELSISSCEMYSLR